MNPWKVSAQFAAFTWYMNRDTGKPATADEAARFARHNWIAFLSHAHAGYGRLLIKITKLPAKKKPTSHQSRSSRTCPAPRREPGRTACQSVLPQAG
jgi:hypothetical protein